MIRATFFGDEELGRPKALRDNIKAATRWGAVVAKRSLVKPEYAAFVAKVITDFAKSEDTVVLFGYLGPSPEEDRSRVYTDLTLHHHIEISDADILHVEPVSKEDAASGTYIWIKADARVIHRRTEVKASFLEGGIQRRYTQSSYAYDPCCLPPPCPPQSPSPDCPGGSPYPCRSSPTSHSCP